jgi:2-keto-4-pentenoate hydratase
MPHADELPAGRTLSDAQARQAASILAANYSNGTLIERFDAELSPKSLEDGYAVQHHLAHELHFVPVGWKIGLTNARAQTARGVGEPVRGRLFGSRIATAPARLRAPTGKLMLEAEFVFRMGRAVYTHGRELSRADLMDAVASMHLGVELCASRIRAAPPPTFAMTIADNCAHGALVIGNAVDRWQSIDLGGVKVDLVCDGRRVASGSGSEVMEDPLNALLWLAQALGREGSGLASGEWITTGSCLGAPEVRAGVAATALFHGVGEVRLHLDPNGPPAEIPGNLLTETDPNG